MSEPWAGYLANVFQCSDSRCSLKSISDYEFVVRYNQALSRLPAFLDFQLLEFLDKVNHNPIRNPTKMKIHTSVNVTAIFDSLFRDLHHHFPILHYRLEIIVGKSGIQCYQGQVPEFLELKRYRSAHCVLVFENTAFINLIIFLFLRRIVVWVKNVGIVCPLYIFLGKIEDIDFA